MRKSPLSVFFTIISTLSNCKYCKHIEQQINMKHNNDETFVFVFDTGRCGGDRTYQLEYYGGFWDADLVGGSTGYPLGCPRRYLPFTYCGTTTCILNAMTKIRLEYTLHKEVPNKQHLGRRLSIDLVSTRANGTNAQDSSLQIRVKY